METDILYIVCTHLPGCTLSHFRRQKYKNNIFSAMYVEVYVRACVRASCTIVRKIFRTFPDDINSPIF
jgi:hypothetical protein